MRIRIGQVRKFGKVGCLDAYAFPIWLGDFHTPDRLRAITARLQLRANSRPVVAEVVRQFIDAHAVNAGRAFVLAYLLQCALQIGPFQHLGQQRLGVNRLRLS
jgi:hypothetical protein